jgi:L-threonylcarbamoyladenylate synthase
MTSSNPLAQAGIMAVDDAAIAAAVAQLRGGGIVALPTETVYGLAADAANADGVAAIYRTKGRPDFNPLIVHVLDAISAEKLAVFDDRAHRLASAFWPGPLTMVLPLRDDAVNAGAITRAVTAGLPTIALRSPAHPVMRAVLAQSGLSLAAPSANRSGGISPTRAQHVASSLGDNAPMILDGGACAAGLESTIVALRPNGWQILRHGTIPQSAVAALLGGAPDPVTDSKIEAPGQLAGHYAPTKPLRLNVPVPDTDEWHIGFGAIAGHDNLSVTGDLAQAAARLFDAMHIADQSEFARIAVAPIPGHDIGAAIHDRLIRASAG